MRKDLMQRGPEITINSVQIFHMLPMRERQPSTKELKGRESVPSESLDTIIGVVFTTFIYKTALLLLLHRVQLGPKRLQAYKRVPVESKPSFQTVAKR